MSQNNIVIGITGTKGSGKDTLASMLAYIMRVGKAKADFYEWKEKIYPFYIENKFVNIIHFYDELKRLCSFLFGIDIKFFNSPKFKDEQYYYFTCKMFISQKDYDAGGYQEITIDDLINNNLDLHAARIVCNRNAKKAVIKLRTILQYVGTELIRNKINRHFWIEKTIDMINDILYLQNVIVPDVRFDDEAEAIKGYENNIIIKVIRDGHDATNHESEQGINNRYIDYMITNNGNLITLFYKLLNTIKFK